MEGEAMYFDENSWYLGFSHSGFTAYRWSFAKSQTEVAQYVTHVCNILIFRLQCLEYHLITIN